MEQTNIWNGFDNENKWNCYDQCESFEKSISCSNPLNFESFVETTKRELNPLFATTIDKLLITWKFPYTYRMANVQQLTFDLKLNKQ